jgi:hypothetical protein
MTPRQILAKTTVSLRWLLFQVRQGEINPDDAAWSLCPDVDPITAGFIKLVGHTKLVFQNWLNYTAENGYDQIKETIAHDEICAIWNLERRGTSVCHLKQRD